jgi:hypothetical protein
MFTHGAQAVVNTSQLHTRGETPPVASHIVSRAFTAPAPPDLSQDIPEFTPSITFEFENLTEDMADVFMDEVSESDDDNDFDFDFDEDTSFTANSVFNIVFDASVFNHTCSGYRDARDRQQFFQQHIFPQCHRGMP